MNETVRIRLQSLSAYSYGAYHAGFELFESLLLENQTERAFSSLKISISTMPNVLLQADGIVDFLAPFGRKNLCCDFVTPDLSVIAAVRTPLSVTVFVTLTAETGERIQSYETTVQILPYRYFPGLSSQPETLAFFVTPHQEELSAFDCYAQEKDALSLCRSVYEDIKNRKITYVSEDYSGSVPLPVRLCESVWRGKAANSLEFALLYASVCERLGLSPVLCFAGKKVLAGIVEGKRELPLFSVFSPKSEPCEDLRLLDCASFAYGSELSFDEALFHCANWLKLNGEKLTVFSILSARKHHLLPLPDRTGAEQGNSLSSYVSDLRLFDDREKELLGVYAFHEKITSALTHKPLRCNTVQKGNHPFVSTLDANQNKILNHILSKDFTLIRAQTGSGVTSLFSHAAAWELKHQRKVLYLADPLYHPGDFQKRAADLFHPGFVLDLTDPEKKTLSKEELPSFFVDYEALWGEKKRAEDAVKKIDGYYENLEGNGKIVSSFLVGADRYHQLREASDAIIFSAEQIALLSDEKVSLWFSLINDMARAMSEAGGICENPLIFIRHKKFSYEYKSRLIRAVEDLLHAGEEVLSLKEQLQGYFPSLNGIRSYPSFRAFIDLTRLFFEFKTVPLAFFEGTESIEESVKNVTALIQAKNENDVIEQTIRVSFDEEIFALDARELYSRYTSLQNDKGLKAMTQRYNVLRAVKRHLLPNCDVENVEYILSKLDSYQKNSEKIRREKELVFRLLSIRESDQDGWDQLRVAMDLCYQSYYIFQNYFPTERMYDFVCDFCKAAEISGVRERIESVHRAEKDYASFLEALEREETVPAELFCHNSDEDYFQVAYRSLQDVLSHIDRLIGWCFWLDVKDRALQNGMRNVVLAIEGGKVTAEDLKKSFLRAFFKAVCEHNFIEHPELIPEKFPFQECFDAFRESSKKLLEIQRAERNAALSAARMEKLPFESELPDPVEVLSQAPKKALDLYPCVVAEISEAKRLFSKTEPLFDLILVDQRSPLSLKDFLWMFAAGKKVAFASNLSRFCAQRSLAWNLDSPAFDFLWRHTEEKLRLSASYRSTPEMTAVKNAFHTAFYSDARLYSIPPRTARIPLEHIFVDGAWDEECKGANLPEAQFAVEWMLKFAMEEKEKSLSVTTSTVAQKNLILRLLAQKMRHQEELIRLFQRPFRISVSSLEDPLPFADVVLFSATYAADRRVHGARLPLEIHSFGYPDPGLAMENLISSAGERMVILSGFGQEEIKRTGTVLPALSAFSALFSLADSDRRNHTFALSDPEECGCVVRHLERELSRRGFHVLLGVQSGRYFLDLAVSDERGDFLLGVLSDQTVVAHASHVSEIEIANGDFYRKHGWNLYRLRSADAFVHFDQVLHQILSLLSGEGKSTVPMDLI